MVRCTSNWKSNSTADGSSVLVKVTIKRWCNNFKMMKTVTLTATTTDANYKQTATGGTGTITDDRNVIQM